MLRHYRSFALLALAALGSFSAVCFSVASSPPPAQDDAAPSQQAAAPTTKPDGEHVPDKAAERALVEKWKSVLGQWHKEDPPEPADNSFCYVCHLNYDEENLVTIHHKVGVGCETCHGISDKHSEDEDNITPPDVMFPRKQIIAFCMECHEKKDLVEEDSHDELFDADSDSDKTCMDCHGKKHELKVRTRRWDKLTGKLIWDDGVRMMEEQEKP